MSPLGRTQFGYRAVVTVTDEVDRVNDRRLPRAVYAEDEGRILVLVKVDSDWTGGTAEAGKR